MSVFKKLFSAFKGGINDAAESVVDANQLRILEQEIREFVLLFVMLMKVWYQLWLSVK
ncbi:PspA/IM30 family protein [Vibrio nitrifigilis]|uniref:Uncharacterized protein n=1 Tax=Vibrio nitrifigilis TaxID=2789781 RepID=A0ABS0GME6_9VIBR|nr:hypothetical protein [Vibrio nitrifigilis]MBF9003631.1 hypothetical protein [Vibrio nitrifigilis]